MEQNHSNKAIVAEFYQQVIGQRDLATVHKIIAEDYIQHNPLVKTGKAGLLETLEFLKNLPPSDTTPKMLLIGEDDFVVTHFKLVFAGQHQVVTDLFRLYNGQIVEHWDAIQIVDSQYFGQIAVAETEIVDQCFTTQNKALTDDYCQLWMARKYGEMQQLTSETSMLYCPMLCQTKEQVIDKLQGIHLEKVHRIIGEGSFVLAQCTGVVNQVSQVVYGIFKLANHQIESIWIIHQPIPEQMAHNNGMI